MLGFIEAAYFVSLDIFPMAYNFGLTCRSPVVYITFHAGILVLNLAYGLRCCIQGHLSAALSQA
jgi:hypothetical protein